LVVVVLEKRGKRLGDKRVGEKKGRGMAKWAVDGESS